MEDPHGPQTRIREGACAIKIRARTKTPDLAGWRSRRLAMVHPRLPNALRPSFRAASSSRTRPRCTRPSSTLAPHVTSQPQSPSSEDSFVQRRITALRQALLAAEDPSRIWAHYTNFVNFFHHDALPLELHRQVLRQCSIPPHLLRLVAAKHLLEGRKPTSPHMHEGRFQAVIHNIRALGHTPSLEDYHYILEQFAAVGHYLGSLQVYQEITHLGQVPEPKTIALCLQAVAHRLSLPVLKTYQPRLVSQTRKILDDLMADMRKYDIPFTQPVLDLALRIYKETVDKEGFEKLVKFAYGIDLSNPDCPPLEFLEGQPQSSPPSVVPFSTHALNTIIDTLGRLGDISKLVQAFEVLTQPLPQAGQHIFSSFDDEEDFGVSVDVPSPPNYTYPHAEPNTTTYHMLLRHVAQADHAILSRHYIIQALYLDRKVNWDIIMKLRHRIPPEQIEAPRFSLTRRMLLSIFGHTNRQKHVALMRWLSDKLPKIQRSKKYDLKVLNDLRERLEASHEALEAEVLPKTRAPPLPSDDFRDLLPAMVEARAVPSKTIAVDMKNLGRAFDVDINNTSVYAPPPKKMLNLDLHIRLLTQDLKEITILAKTLDEVLGRTIQRKKESLGRRVWRSQDIYFSDINMRKEVSRQRWRDIVHFRPRRDLFRQGEPQPFERDTAPHMRKHQTKPQPQQPVSPPADNSTATTEKPSQMRTLIYRIRSLVPS
ncbi:hypothetical protein NP233_g8350 [Leucocoprinus birnbaumii]|uniref:Uncharacterized protein n=1 Tax=Leucocoprinus birnbaumii TaxID=56174 RepID=A0AAD5VML8_9AGAR|nr:hypothetical protein NP233_g8350 [Leucocoprinus birnbaumii]